MFILHSGKRWKLPGCAYTSVHLLYAITFHDEVTAVLFQLEPFLLLSSDKYICVKHFSLGEVISSLGAKICPKTLKRGNKKLHTF